MFKSRVLLAGLLFSGAVYGGLDTACAATERVVEQAGDWKGVLLDESNLALTFSQDGVVIRIAPSASGDYIAMEAHVPATEAVSASFQAGKFALPLRRISTVDGVTLFGAEIPRDTTRDFIHAFTASPSGMLIWGTNQKIISLSGTSSAVSGLDFYAHEHRLNLPAPFTIESANNPVVSASVNGQSPDYAVEPSEPVDMPQQISDGATCKQDWHKCKDNSDMANNYMNNNEARAACEMASEKNAEYGTPEFPGFWSGGAFGSYKLGNDAPKTGAIQLIEKNAKFQNQFGAMVHSTVLCNYDFKSQKVVDLQILPH
ncbi:MAG: hypothetical protein ABF628_00835 [Acetobacter orientalis]|uniref:hypothetical protein n=1 Tax=Acetobacter orientalis TaxID=146474 RepID=UPI0039EACFE9